MYQYKKYIQKFYLILLYTNIINRLQVLKFGFMAPFDILWRLKPTVGHFRVFCYVCYVFIQDHLLGEFNKKAVMCIFSNVDERNKGWWCCDPTNTNGMCQGMLRLMKVHCRGLHNM